MTLLPCPPVGWKRPPLLFSTRLLVLEALAHARNIVLHDAFYRPSIRTLVRAYEYALFGNKRPIYDHRPPLAERKFNPRIGDTDPRANDPHWIEAITQEEHDRRTFGPGGKKRITSAGSDAHRRAKVRRANKPPKAKLKIPSRGFNKRLTRGFDGVVRVRKERKRR